SGRRSGTRGIACTWRDCSRCRPCGTATGCGIPTYIRRSGSAATRVDAHPVVACRHDDLVEPLAVAYAQRVLLAAQYPRPRERAARLEARSEAWRKLVQGSGEDVRDEHVGRRECVVAGQREFDARLRRIAFGIVASRFERLRIVVDREHVLRTEQRGCDRE